ncbi:uncharacterized protein [Hetaerina americana]|uniref:uncharacterized protein n=1 Tax=Hetaerina americana TaxID=62018 RepID=UPI003A7F2577
MEKDEFRALIKHYYIKGLTAEEIKAELDEVHGTSAPVFATVYNWLNMFKRGCTSTNDEHLSGNPLKVTSSEMSDKIDDMVLSDRQREDREIVKPTDISQGIYSSNAAMSDTKTSSHVCVLCNAKLGSKEALQEHFRKHANREIDGKGQPRKAKGDIVANGPKKTLIPTSPQNLQKVNLPRPATSSDSPAAPAVGSTASSSCKTPNPKNTPTTTTAVATKSSGKPSSGIVCDVCGQEFETVTIAIQHKFKKHPDSAIKHFCPHCGQQFPLKINRDKHLQLHPSDPPSQLFPCQECGVVFYNAQAQSYHFKSTHKRIVAIFKPVETPPPSKKIRMNNAGEAQSVYYCHICGYEYIIKFNLQKHIERHHPEEERNAIPEGIIKCTTCDALFYSKKAYDNHNMYHRPDDLYVTSEEQRLQTVSRVDQDFDIRRVQPGPKKFIPVDRPRPTRPSSLSSVEAKKSLRKFKGKRNNSQKTQRKAGTQSMEGSSDDTDEWGSSSESELSPDSGPDSDSDSDVPLKKCAKQDAGKPLAGKGGGEAGEKKTQGTKKEGGKVMPKSQAMRKKAKIHASESSSEGEGVVVKRGRGGGMQGSRKGRKRGRGRACNDLSECSRELTTAGNSALGDKGSAGLDKVKSIGVLNGGEKEGIDLKMATGKKDGCEEGVEVKSGDEKAEGQSGKGASISSNRSKDVLSCGGEAAVVSEQVVDVSTIKSEPSEERKCLRSGSPTKEKLSSSVKKIPHKDTEEKSS